MAKPVRSAAALAAISLLLLAAGCRAAAPAAATSPVPAVAAGAVVERPADVIQDKIRGGLLGQLMGDLNGLKHEFKYLDEPGNVTTYVPGLPVGAWTDDDTDFEWVHVVAMHQRGVPLIPAGDIAALWKAHINRRIWCANQFARQLMDLGLVPPLTGNAALNPWSDFNIAGQFTCETYGLIAPGLPQTAARIGLHYTRAAIDGEPAQTTQLFDAMIATAFLTDDLERILDAGMAALDPRSSVRQVVADVRAWHRQHPDDWRAVRRLVKEKYIRFGGAMRDRNGYELNTASIIAALVFGQGDYVRTSITAFNFGWDADCNAATACTVVGVIKGARWMQAQGWTIKDEYRNTTRDAMPMDETITRFGDRLIALAERTLAERGGGKAVRDGRAVYRIPVEPPANVEPLADEAAEPARLRTALRPEIEAALRGGGDPQALARAAYLAIALNLAADVQRQHPEAWPKAVAALEGYPKVVSVIYYESPTPLGDALRRRATAAGLKKPEKKVKIW